MALPTVKPPKPTFDAVLGALDAATEALATDAVKTAGAFTVSFLHNFVFKVLVLSLEWSLYFVFYSWRATSTSTDPPGVSRKAHGQACLQS